MSLLSMQGGATGTGTVTLLAPITNTDRTLTLPDATGTVALQGGAGVGKVLQVVSTTATTSLSTTSGTFTAIGLSASITPTSATSKVFVIAHYIMDTQSSNLAVQSSIFRSSTDLGVVAAHYAAAAGYLATTHTCSILDSPSTTSSTTYSIRARVSAGAGTISAASPSTITLMEIAA